MVHAARSHARSAFARLTASALVPLLLVAPGEAMAAAKCMLRSAEGTISIDQQGLNIVLNLRQDGNNLTGSAHYTRFETGKTIRGDVITGYIDSSRLQLRIRWDGMSIGQYTGSIDASGRARGYTHDERNAGASVPWKTRRALSCRLHYRY
jgi:hypothetical protein